MKRTQATHLPAGILFFLLSVAVVSAVNPSRRTYETHCQILDEPTEPQYRVSLAYVASSGYEGYGRSSQLECDGMFKMGYFRDVAYGTAELTGRFKGFVFPDSVGIELPDQLLKLAVDGSWTWRYVNELSLQIRAEPGIYADLEGISLDTLFIPLGCRLIRTFNPDISGVVGLDVRPGFGREIMPLVGVEWSPLDEVHVRAMLPDSRVLFSFPDWSAYVGFDWQNLSYRMRESGPYSRDLITLEDYRLYGGITGWIGPDIHVFGELGKVFNRSVEFEDGPSGGEESVDVESARVFRVGVGGPF